MASHSGHAQSNLVAIPAPGHHERGRQKLRQQTFETAIIERYRRREGSVEEALIEMYLAGVSMRRVESPSTGVGSQQEDLDREAIDAYSRGRFFSGAITGNHGRSV